MRSREIEELKKRLKLNNLQREVLVGILLGDAHLETQNNGRTYRLKVEQSKRHKEYVRHLYEIFKEWVLTEPREKVVKSRNSESVNVCFQTLSHPSFRFYANQFYLDGKKVVPRLIHRWLSDKALAYWFEDDGSIKSKDSKSIIFNTQAYPLNDIERLIKVLDEKFGFIVKERKQKEGYQIYISGKSFEQFKSVVEPHMIDEMKYKLPKDRFNKLPKV